MDNDTNPLGCTALGPHSLTGRTKAGLCNRCYLASRSTRPKFEQGKYLSLVIRTVPLMTEGQCVTEWPGKTAKGRPTVSRPFGRNGRPATMAAVRYAWFVKYGKLPEGQLNHRQECNNGACWNVLHVYEGTQAENNADTRATGRAPDQRLARLEAAILADPVRYADLIDLL